MSDETKTTQEQSHDQAMKMQSLREMIGNAEKTIQGAKAMLLQLEGKKKAGRRMKMEDEEDGGSVVQGTFDGQVMLGADGKQYPVPANYASKSKLVEGDMLKLHITPEGSFIYKQIGPVERKHALGIVTQDEGSNYIVIADGKPYRILLASITYFKAQPGDEAAIVTSRDIDSRWASLENIVQKAKYGADELPIPEVPAKRVTKKSSPKEDEDLDDDDEFLNEWKKDLEKAEKELAKEEKSVKKSAPVKAKKETKEEADDTLLTEDSDDDLLEEWRADIEAIEKEIAESEKAKTPAVAE